MKTLRLIAASAVSAALVASMAVSASATTYKEVVQAAKDAGVQSTNVQELENFLSANSTYFTSAQYDEMIATVKSVSDTYVAPKAMEMFGKTPGELTEDEKWQLGQTWTQEERNAITGALKNLGDKYGVEVDIDKITKGDYTVAAKISTSSGGSATQTVTTNPVAATGAEAESGVNSGVVAGAGLALVVALTGVVVVARKNKA